MKISEFNSWPSHYRVTTSGKLFTHTHTCASVAKQYNPVEVRWCPVDASGVTQAMRYRLTSWCVYLRAQDFWKDISTAPTLGSSSSVAASLSPGDLHCHSLNGSLDSVNGDLQFLLDRQISTPPPQNRYPWTDR